MLSGTPRAFHRKTRCFLWKVKCFLGCPEWLSAEIIKHTPKNHLMICIYPCKFWSRLRKISFNLCQLLYYIYVNFSYIIIFQILTACEGCKNWINSENYMIGDTLILLFIKKLIIFLIRRSIIKNVCLFIKYHWIPLQLFRREIRQSDSIKSIKTPSTNDSNYYTSSTNKGIRTSTFHVSVPCG